MDLLSIVQAVWRRKAATIPVTPLTLLGAFYIVKVKPPVYQASSSLLVLAAPGPPTASQIAADPRLKRINPNNPYVSYGNLTVVADSVVELVTSNADQAALIRAGANPKYELTLSTAVGNPPIIEVTGIGSTAQQAIVTASVVTRAAPDAALQPAKGTGCQQELYMIKSVVLARPSTAQLSSSGKLRSLIAVLAVGAILLFVVISITDALARGGRIDGPVTPGCTRAEERPRGLSACCRPQSPSGPRDTRPPGAGVRRHPDPRPPQPTRPVSSGRPNGGR